jgi:antirestriction protein ArdC
MLRYIHVFNAEQVGSWLRKVKEDRKLVIQAAPQAQHAVDYILGVKFENGDE